MKPEILRKTTACAAAAALAAVLCVPVMAQALASDGDADTSSSVVSAIESIRETVGEYDILAEELTIKEKIYGTFRTDVYSNYTPADEIEDNSFYNRTSYPVGPASWSSGWSVVSIGSIADDGTEQLCVNDELESIIVDSSVDLDAVTLEYDYKKYATEDNGYLTVADIAGEAAEDLDAIAESAEELAQLDENVSVFRLGEYITEIDGRDTDGSVVITALDLTEGDDGEWYMANPDNPMVIILKTDQAILINVEIPDGCTSLHLNGYFVDIANSETGEIFDRDSTMEIDGSTAGRSVFFNFGSYDGEILIDGGESDAFEGTLIAPNASVTLSTDSMCSSGQLICRELTNTSRFYGYGSYLDIGTALIEDDDLDLASRMITVVAEDEDGNVVSDSLTSLSFALMKTDEDFTNHGESYSSYSYGTYTIYGFCRNFVISPSASSSTSYYYLADKSHEGEMLCRLIVTKDEDGTISIEFLDSTEIHVTVTDDDLGDSSYYTSLMPDDIYTYLSVQVICVDGDGEAAEGRNEAGQYTFVLQEYDGSWTTKIGEEITAVNDADGMVYFPDIQVTWDGNTFRYFTITQVAGEDDEIEYDTEPVQVLLYQKRITTDESSSAYLFTTTASVSNEIVTNVVSVPDPVNVVLSLNKVLSDESGAGRSLKDGEFSFALVDSDGNTIATAVNDADGSITFDAITFEEEGEYTYTVYEIIPDDDDRDAHIGYDETVLSVLVSVTKSDGVLTAVLESE